MFGAYFRAGAGNRPRRGGNTRVAAGRPAWAAGEWAGVRKDGRESVTVAETLHCSKTTICPLGNNNNLTSVEEAGQDKS